MEDNPIENNDEDNVKTSQVLINKESERSSFQIRPERTYYYQRVFEKLEKGQNSWNWAAFLFQFNWMIYRKMYGYALLDFMIALVLAIPAAASFFALSSIMFCIYAFLHGYYGNALYYRVVKQRTAEGYYCIDGYTSTSWSLLVIWIASIIPVVHVIPVLPALITVGVFYFTDQWMNKQYHLTHKGDKEFEINKENIDRYLSQHQTSVFLFIAIFISIFLMLLTWGIGYAIYASMQPTIWDYLSRFSSIIIVGLFLLFL